MVGSDEDQAAVVKPEFLQSIEYRRHLRHGASRLPSVRRAIRRTDGTDEFTVCVEHDRQVRNADVYELVQRAVHRWSQPPCELVENGGAVPRVIPASARVAWPEYLLEAPFLIVVDSFAQDVRRMPEQRQIGKLRGGKPRVLAITH